MPAATDPLEMATLPSLAAGVSSRRDAGTFERLDMDATFRDGARLDKFLQACAGTYGLSVDLGTGAAAHRICARREGAPARGGADVWFRAAYLACTLNQEHQLDGAFDPLFVPSSRAAEVARAAVRGYPAKRPPRLGLAPGADMEDALLRRLQPD